jgi:hypothetical protein
MPFADPTKEDAATFSLCRRHKVGRQKQKVFFGKGAREFSHVGNQARKPLHSLEKRRHL